LPPILNCFTRQALPTVNRKYFFVNILCIGPFCSQKTHNRTLLLGSGVIRNSRHFDYWNQLLNMRMRVYYPNCHEVALCWYLVIHRKSVTSILPFVTYLLTPRRINIKIQFMPDRKNDTSPLQNPTG
jgi:hypothetical protein